MATRKKMMPREVTPPRKPLKVDCPTCKAPIGMPCYGPRGQQRTACHIERWKDAEEAQ